QGGLLGGEQRLRGVVLEVGGLNLQHDVLDDRVVRPVGGEQRLPRTGDRSGPCPKIEQQPRRVQRGPVQLLLDRHPARGGGGFDRCGVQVRGQCRKVPPARGAVRRRRGARIGPRGGGRRVLAEREVDDVPERERLDPLGEIGGEGGGRDRRGRVARGALARRSPPDVGGGRGAGDATDTGGVGQAPAQGEQRKRP